MAYQASTSLYQMSTKGDAKSLASAVNDVVFFIQAWQASL
jgi:hypothetical protein